MSFPDFIVFIIYVFIFNAIFSFRRRQYTDARLRKYHKIGFWIKVFSTFAFCIFVVYVSPGDSTGLYYTEGYNIYKLILKDPSNIQLLFIPAKDFDQALLSNIANLGYFNEESNFMVTKITAFLCFFTFGQFMAINLIFSMISFTGVWRLYRFFYEQYPDLHKQFSFAILFLPTFVFWSSGILKDPLCTGALGWLTYSLYSIFYLKKNPVKFGILVVLFGYLIIVLKVYIIVSYLPFFVIFLILQNVNLIKNKFVKILLVSGFLIGSIFSFIRITSTMQKALGNFAGQGIAKSVKTYQVNYENQAFSASSNFSLGVEFDGSVNSLIKLAPAAIVATLFRPFIWESKKLSTLLSSLESLAFMIFTIFVLIKVGIKKMVKTIVSKAVVMYCFLYSIIFSLFVGATTLNFGSLVRYKIPGIPFYLLAMFFILYFNNKLKVKPGISQAV
ncbi:MAG: hypothetical protein ABJA37_01280 [Ferruginibacter sp.]